MPPINTTDLAARAKSQRDAAIEKESATLREWLSGISSQKGAIAGSVNNLVSINKPREVTIDVSLPIPSDVEQKKPAPIDPRKTLPESVKSGAGIPRGCPYDLKVDAVDETESYLSAVKHTSCDSNSIGNNVYERYAAVKVDQDAASFTSYFGVSSDSYYATTVKADESSFWGYSPSGHNFKTVASQTQTLMELWEGSGNYFGAYTNNTEAGHYLQNSNSFLGGVIKSSESSLWGYTGSGPNYMLKSTSSKADLQLWSSSGPTTSAWAGNSDAGVKVENGDDYSFLDIGQLWMNLASAEFHGYGGGLYIKNTDGVWVDIQPPEQNCYFQKVLLGDMTNRWVLCSEDTGDSLDCANLPSPKVGNIEAFQVKTPSYCGPFSTSTVLDLTNTKLTYTGGSKSAVFDMEGLYFTDPSGDSALYEPSQLKLWKSSGGPYAELSLGSQSGTLRLEGQNDATASMNADLLTIATSSGTASLDEVSLKFTNSGSGSANYNVSNAYLTDGISEVTISVPDRDCYFQKVLLGDMTNRWVLCSEDTGGSLDCANLPSPKVGNMEAFQVKTPSYCGPFSTSTVLDLTNTELTYTGGSESAVYKLDGVYINSGNGDGSYLDKSTLYIWDSLGVSAKLSTNSGSGTLDVVNNLGGTGYYAATLAKLEDSNGTATLSTQSIFIEKTGGSYAALNGSGWLQLRDSQGKEVYLDPTKIVFSEDSFTATHDAYGFVAQDSGEEGRLNSNSLSLFNNSGSADLSISELTFVGGSDSANYKISGVYINSSGDGSYLNKSTLSIWSGSGATGSVSVGTAPFGAVFRTDTGTGKNANYSAVEASISDTSGNTATLNTTGLQVQAGGGSEGKIWAGGVYVNDGGNYVNITPPGKDAYFQSMSFCVDGTTKIAMVLMTTPE